MIVNSPLLKITPTASAVFSVNVPPVIVVSPSTFCIAPDWDAVFLVYVSSVDVNSPR